MKVHDENSASAISHIEFLPLCGERIGPEEAGGHETLLAPAADLGLVNAGRVVLVPVLCPEHQSEKKYYPSAESLRSILIQTLILISNQIWWDTVPEG